MSERLDESGIESTTVSIMRTSHCQRWSSFLLRGSGRGGGPAGQHWFGAPEVWSSSPSHRKEPAGSQAEVAEVPHHGFDHSHAVEGRFGACKVLLIPASPGTGVVAGAAVRAPLEMLGIRDCMTKCHGSTNTLNIVKAVFNGLEQLKSREEIEAARGRTLGHSDTEIQQKLDKPAPVSTEGDADAETPEAPAEAAANEATAS